MFSKKIVLVVTNNPQNSQQENNVQEQIVPGEGRVSPAEHSAPFLVQSETNLQAVESSVNTPQIMTRSASLQEIVETAPLVGMSEEAVELIRVLLEHVEHSRICRYITDKTGIIKPQDVSMQEWMDSLLTTAGTALVLKMAREMAGLASVNDDSWLLFEDEDYNRDIQQNKPLLWMFLYQWANQLNPDNWPWLQWEHISEASQLCDDIVLSAQEQGMDKTLKLFSDKVQLQIGCRTSWQSYVDYFEESMKGFPDLKVQLTRYVNTRIPHPPVVVSLNAEGVQLVHLVMSLSSLIDDKKALEELNQKILDVHPFTMDRVDQLIDCALGDKAREGDFPSLSSLNQESTQ